MTRIGKLTKAQEKRLPVFRQEILDIATSGKRTDRAALELAIKDFYAEIGKPAPLVVILQSPLQAMMAIKFMETVAARETGNQLYGQLSGQLGGQLYDQLYGQLGGQLRGQLYGQLSGQLGDQLSGQLRGQLSGQLRGQLYDQLYGQLGGQLRGQLYDQLYGQLGGQLYDQLRGQLSGQLRGQLYDQLSGQLGGQLYDQLYDQLYGQLSDQLGDQLSGQLGGQLYDQLYGQLGDQLGGQLYDQLRGQLGDQLSGQKIWNGNFLWGSQDLYWIAWATFAEQIGVQLKHEQSRRLDIMYRIGCECEWWWPYEGFCFASERPTSVSWDDARRLHAERGPAVLYEDGYAVYSWHGTNIPAEWITDPGFLTPQVALSTDNAEQRRAACEIIGWERLLSLLDARLIDKDDDDTVGQLYEVDHDAMGGKAKFLRMYCPTGRWFAEPVPTEMQTALEANSWGWDIPKELYRPRVQA